LAIFQRPRGIITLFLILLSFPTPLRAAETEPFSIGTRHPLIAVFGLPNTQGAHLTPPRSVMLRLNLDLANTSIAGAALRENIVVDLEGLYMTISGRYGLAKNLEIGADLPVILLGGGFLDGFIEDFHTTFGFADGGRKTAPRNRVLVRYRRGGLNQLHITSSTAGIGDLRLTGAWQFIPPCSKDHFRLALRGSLKLPTGNPHTLSGSGSTDLAFWLAGDGKLPLASGRFRTFIEGGLLFMTRGNILPDQQRPVVGFGSVGLAFTPASWVDFKGQINAHTAFFSSSDLKTLNAPSVQLTLGGSWYISRSMSFTFGVMEDLTVDTSPDVVIHAGIQYTF